MPGPTTAIPRPDLGAHVNEAAGSMSGFIGLRVLPPFKTASQASFYPIITRESMMKMPETRRAPRTKYNRANWQFEWTSFVCEEHGWEEAGDDDEAKMYANFFDYEKVLTARALAIVLRAREKRVAAAVFNATTWTAVSITNEWDDASNATPAADIKTGKIALVEATGIPPNALIIAYSTFLDLGQCDDVVDRIKYTNPNVVRGEVSAELLAQYFGVDQVLVGNAYYDAALQGQTASMTALWSNEYAMLCRLESGQDLELPSLGRTFGWTGSVPDEYVVEVYRDETVRGDVYRVRTYDKELIICVDAGYLLSNITT